MSWIAPFYTTYIYNIYIIYNVFTYYVYIYIYIYIYNIYTIQNGIYGNLLNLLCDLLRKRKQRVLLNGQVSNWSDVKASVIKGSRLGPLLLFLIYISNLLEG